MVWFFKTLSCDNESMRRGYKASTLDTGVSNISIVKKNYARASQLRDLGSYTLILVFCYQCVCAMTFKLVVQIF